MIYKFFDCTGLTSLNIPNTVTTIGLGAFQGCIGLTSLDIPNTVTTIGDWAFRGCTGLTTISIPNSVTYIGGEAFEDTGITSPVYNAHCFAFMPRSYSALMLFPAELNKYADMHSLVVLVSHQ